MPGGAHGLEGALQMACVAMVRRDHPDVPFIASFNGANLSGSKGRCARAWNAFKARGGSAGHPDLFFYAPSADGTKHGLAVELKTPNGKPPTKAQLEWQVRLRGAGYASEVVDNLADFKRVLRNHLERSGSSAQEAVELD